MRTLIKLFAFCCFTPMALGSDKPDAPVEAPRSASALSSIRKHEIAVEQARQVFLRAQIKADQQEVADLDASLQIAVKGGSSGFEEAKRIDAAKKSAQAQLDSHVAELKSGKSGGEPAGPVVYLDDLQETAEGMMPGDWGVGKHGNLRSSGGAPVSIAGVKYMHALGFNATDNASSILTYTLDGNYKRLAGAAGLNDSARGFAPTLTYRIVGDGRELWRNKPPKAQIGTLYRYELDVSNVKTLQLIADCAGSAAGANVVWLEPGLTSK